MAKRLGPAKPRGVTWKGAGGWVIASHYFATRMSRRRRPGREGCRAEWQSRQTMTPVWMREEMKGTKLKKEDLAIR
jgi:hypothetical protein